MYRGPFSFIFIGNTFFHVFPGTIYRAVRLRSRILRHFSDVSESVLVLAADAGLRESVVPVPGAAVDTSAPGGVLAADVSAVDVL
jgi:hypothetical protein